eukprot:scaffold304380_cov17-Tisochrysis_lutea.AAC.1
MHIPHHGVRLATPDSARHLALVVRVEQKACCPVMVTLMQSHLVHSIVPRQETHEATSVLCGQFWGPERMRYSNVSGKKHGKKQGVSARPGTLNPQPYQAR